MQGLQAAMSQLKSSSEKLVNSKLALASLQQAAEGTRMLVPPAPMTLGISPNRKS